MRWLYLITLLLGSTFVCKVGANQPVTYWEGISPTTGLASGGEVEFLNLLACICWGYCGRVGFACVVVMLD